MAKEGRYPDVVVCTNAGGGNLTGTARGLIKAGATSVKVIGASVNLSGLHMASDHNSIKNLHYWTYSLEFHSVLFQIDQMFLDQLQDL